MVIEFTGFHSASGAQLLRKAQIIERSESVVTAEFSTGEPLLVLLQPVNNVHSKKTVRYLVDSTDYAK